MIDSLQVHQMADHEEVGTKRPSSSQDETRQSPGASTTLADIQRKAPLLVLIWATLSLWQGKVSPGLVHARQSATQTTVLPRWSKVKWLSAHRGGKVSAAQVKALALV